MDKFDFKAPAELFPSRNRKVASKVKYRRFDKAADAIRFAVEDLPDHFGLADDPLGTTFDLLRWFNGQVAALLAIAKR